MNSRPKKYKSEKAMTKGVRTQKRKRYIGCQRMPTGGGGTGRKGAIAVPVPKCEQVKPESMSAARATRATLRRIG